MASITPRYSRYWKPYCRLLIAAFLLANLLALKTIFSGDKDHRSMPSFETENADRTLDKSPGGRHVLDFTESRRHRRSVSDNEVGVDGVPLRMDYSKKDVALPGSGPGIGCAEVRRIVGREFLAAGWTKALYKGRMAGGREVALKQVNLNGHDMGACLAANATWWQCYRKSAAKIQKEIVLLRELAHPNVLKVLGYCIPSGQDFYGDDHTEGGGGVVMVTELGQMLDIIQLLQSSWEDRLRLSLGVLRVVHHLAHSPLGSLVMNDFRRQQFVLVDGELRLSDVDDMELDEPECRRDDDCTIRHAAAELVLPLNCVAGRCAGHNERQNVYNAGRHFLSFLLPHGAPPALRPALDEIVSAVAAVSWDSARLLDSLERVRRAYVDGLYLPAQRDHSVSRDFRRVDRSDLPGLYDYRCQLTLSGSGCTLSVFDELEAQQMCRDDRDCLAFVITDQTSWTGRKIAHFKSNFSTPTVNQHATLYEKIT